MTSSQRQSDCQDILSHIILTSLVTQNYYLLTYMTHRYS